MWNWRLILGRSIFSLAVAILAVQDVWGQGPAPAARLRPVNPGSASVFVHRAAASNISSNWTVIDHSLTNGNPAAVLLVTPNWNPEGSGGVYNDHAVGVWYTNGRWAIFNQDRAAMPAGAAFNVAILGASAQAESAPSPVGPTRRTVLADGTTEIRYPDGRITILSRGSRTDIFPNGRRQTVAYSQVPATLPAGLPADQTITLWLEKHNANLLDMIRSATTDGEASVQNYLGRETASASIYQKIEGRRSTLATLMTPRE